MPQYIDSYPVVTPGALFLSANLSGRSFNRGGAGIQTQVRQVFV